MEWINVKERLPVACRTRLLVFERIYGQATIGVYHEGWYTDISDDYSDVTHWMPLPKAPDVKDEK